MYAEGGWKPSREPPDRRPRITKRQELVILWILILNVVLLLIAPIGGATLIHAALAALR
ncbi:MAG: hypothetical protein PGN34_20885 [Methylobacterium frigidaeris]